MAKFRTHYDHLHLAENASLDDIRASFKIIFLKYHPSKHHGCKQRAARFMQGVKESYSILSDPEQRLDYDKWIVENRPLTTLESDEGLPDQKHSIAEASEVEKQARRDAIALTGHNSGSRKSSIWEIPAIVVLVIALGFAGWWATGPRDFQIPIFVSKSKSAEEGVGYEFSFENKCRHPISLLVRYNGLDGEWHVEGWWDVEPGGSFYLEDESGKRLTSSNSVWYYYARTTDGANIEWKGNSRLTFNGARIAMIEMEDNDGDSNWSTSCDQPELEALSDQ